MRPNLATYALTLASALVLVISLQRVLMSSSVRALPRPKRLGILGLLVFGAIVVFVMLFELLPV
jgi:hypothetical protein